jgi:type I restriction enzyme S subunit
VKSEWPKRPLLDLVKSKSGDSKIIKGKQSSTPKKGLFQGFSATGPDVWVKEAHYDQPGVVVSAVGARCGKTFLAQGCWTAIANSHAIIPGKELNVKWFWYLTNDEKFWVRGGSAQPFVKVVLRRI